MADLASALQHLLNAKRINGTKQSYKQDNPAESQKVFAYLNGGARPSGVTSEMGLGLVEVEDVRRGVVPPPPPPPTGDKFASPTGSDSTGTGTFANPYKTWNRLLDSLAPGQVGQLRGGSYGGDSYQESTTSGTANGRITLTNYPGEKATLVGWITLRGRYVTIRNLYVDATSSQVIDHCALPGASGIGTIGSDMIIEYCDISQRGPRGSAFLQGDHSGGTGHRNIYRFNRIHDWGQCKAQDHGIYWGYGDDGRVYGNWFWGKANNAETAGWGVQLYPDCVRLKVFANVFDNMAAGGVVISDTDGGTTNNCDVYNNVVMRSVGNSYAGTGGAGISGVGCVAPGNGNKFRDNCCYANPGGIAGELNDPQYYSQNPPANITITGNNTLNPQLANPNARDYRPTVNTPLPVSGYGLPTFVVGPTV